MNRPYSKLIAAVCLFVLLASHKGEELKQCSLNKGDVGPANLDLPISKDPEASVKFNFKNVVNPSMQKISHAHYRMEEDFGDLETSFGTYHIKSLDFLAASVTRLAGEQFPLEIIAHATRGASTKTKTHQKKKKSSKKSLKKKVATKPKSKNAAKGKNKTKKTKSGSKLVKNKNKKAKGKKGPDEAEDLFANSIPPYKAPVKDTHYHLSTPTHKVKAVKILPPKHKAKKPIKLNKKADSKKKKTKKNPKKKNPAQKSKAAKSKNAKKTKKDIKNKQDSPKSAPKTKPKTTLNKKKQKKTSKKSPKTTPKKSKNIKKKTTKPAKKTTKSKKTSKKPAKKTSKAKKASKKPAKKASKKAAKAKKPLKNPSKKSPSKPSSTKKTKAPALLKLSFLFEPAQVPYIELYPLGLGRGMVKKLPTKLKDPLNSKLTLHTVFSLNQLTDKYKKVIWYQAQSVFDGCKPATFMVLFEKLWVSPDQLKEFREVHPWRVATTSKLKTKIKSNFFAQA